MMLSSQYGAYPKFIKKLNDETLGVNLSFT
jgi:hypothetical protein